MAKTDEFEQCLGCGHKHFNAKPKKCIKCNTSMAFVSPKQKLEKLARKWKRKAVHASKYNEGMNATIYNRCADEMKQIISELAS